MGLGLIGPVSIAAWITLMRSVYSVRQDSTRTASKKQANKSHVNASSALCLVDLRGTSVYM